MNIGPPNYRSSSAPALGWANPKKNSSITAKKEGVGYRVQQTVVNPARHLVI